MFQDMIRAISGEVSANLALEELRRMQEIDRWFTFPAFERSAAYAVSRWKRSGLKAAKVETFPADGRTRVGAWVMPYAWDAADAVLTIEEPQVAAGRVIARYRDVPCSLAMWSAPTPPEGVAADLVWVEDAANPKSYEGVDVAGKIVFTSARPPFSKGLAAKHGAIGMLSDFVTHRLDKPDCAFWTNAWSDDPGGWGLTEKDSRIFGFDITPRQGDWLREMLRTHGRVRVRAKVDTRIYEGTLPAATAVIPGEDRRYEVLVLGHAFEQGANDNASGCAVMLESARALAQLIRDGVLPRPRRSIRFLIVSECYSTFAYAERFRQRMADTVAGVCFDSVAHVQSVCHAALSIRRPPDANASFVTAFSERLGETILSNVRPEYRWTAGGQYITTDNVVSDPLIGPPTPLFTADPGDRYWHSTGDTLDKVDGDALRQLCVFCAAYLYSIASAGSLDALYFAALATARAKGELSRMMSRTLEECRDGLVDFVTARRRLLYVADRGAREVDSVRTLLPLKSVKSIEAELAAMTCEILAAGNRDAEQLERLMRQCGKSLGPAPLSDEAQDLRDRARGLVVRRLFIGTMSFDTIPESERKGFSDPRWDDGLTAALFWCDGNRTLYEALDLAGNELCRDVFDLVPVFEFMAGRGLVELRRL